MNYSDYFKPQKKYKNKKCHYGDMVFDSKKEANRYCELRLLEQAHLIKNLRTQVEYELIPAQYEDVKITLKSGKIKEKKQLVEKKCSYIADYVYEDLDGNVIVEDTKSEATKTSTYIIKRKLMLYIHNIKIKEV